MTEQKTKLEQALSLSEEILGDLESSSLTFEQILQKCKRLARLRDDFEALQWFILELHGYYLSTKFANVTHDDLDRHAGRSCRYFQETDPATNKQVIKYWPQSVSEIESAIQTNMVKLENLKPPNQFTPAVNKHSYDNTMYGGGSSETVVEKYQDVLNAIKQQEYQISESVKVNRALLSKIKNSDVGQNPCGFDSCAKRKSPLL